MKEPESGTLLAIDQGSLNIQLSLTELQIDLFLTLHFPCNYTEPKVIYFFYPNKKLFGEIHLQRKQEFYIINQYESSWTFIYKDKLGTKDYQIDEEIPDTKSKKQQ